MKKKLSLFLILISVGLLTALAAGPVFGGSHGDDWAVPLKEDGVEKAKRVQEKHTNALMARKDVEGTAVGLNANGQASVVIFTAKAGVAGLPNQLDGVPVVVRVTGKFYALASSVAPPPLVAKFTWSCDSLACELDASTTTGRGGKTYSWVFGDGGSWSGEIVNHTYEEYITYTVTLTVTNDKGETATIVKEVTPSDGGGGGVVDADCYTTGETKVRCARPVPIGVSIGHPDITAGTIGMRYKKGDDYYILSNNHVLANMNAAAMGDNALQPGAYDGGADPADSIGTLYDYEPIIFDGSNNTMDAAIALSSTTNLENTTPDDGYGAPSLTPVSATLGMAVKKYGRTTKLTTGTVTEINVTVNVCYEGFPFCTKLAKFVDQISISDGDFSAGGDSGSLIVTNNTTANPVGLLFAGSSTRTLANRIDLVLGRFDTGGSLPPPPPPPSGSLSLTVTTDKAIYVNRENVMITGMVMDGDNPVAGAVVQIKIITYKGNLLGCSPMTNASGEAKCRYKVNANRDGRGLYTVDATASMSGYTSGDDSTTFMVE